MVKHTQGPWKYEDKYVRDPNGNAIADPFCMEETSNEEMKANAHLLAAAWELHGACKEALAVLNQNKTFPEDINAAKQYLADAIAKAEGVK